jgi:GGDEF domain-containing protein
VSGSAASPARRARPVADAPPLDAREVAHAWLVALVAAAPLEAAAALPGPGFAREAPLLTRAVADALAGDAALADVEPGGPLADVAAHAGALACASGPAATLAAVEALRSVTWAALLGGLRRPDPTQVAELADRLALVVATVAAAALEADALGRSPAGAGDPGPDEADAAAPAVPRRAEPRAAARAAGGAEAGRAGEVRAVAPAPPPVAPAPAPPPPAPAPAAVAVREPGGAAAAWTAAIEQALARRREDGRPFAVLCVEVAELDRLLAADAGGRLAAELARAERLLAAALRPSDVLLPERPGRAWVVAPDTDPVTARGLAELLAAAVAAATTHAGAPLHVAIGVASAPPDAASAADLEARAEEGLFAARAAGVRVGARP